MLGKIIDNFGKTIPAEISEFSYYRSTSDKWRAFSTASLANLAWRPFEAFSKIFTSSSYKPCKVGSNRHSTSNCSRKPFFRTAISALLNLHYHKLELAHGKLSMVFELQQFDYLFYKPLLRLNPADFCIKFLVFLNWAHNLLLCFAVIIKFDSRLC